MGKETVTYTVPDLTILYPKTLDLPSKIDYDNEVINVSFPRSLTKTGLYFLSVDVDGGKFKATESERYETGEEVWHDLNIRHNLRTGKVIETTAVCPGAEYFTERSKLKRNTSRKTAQVDSGVQTNKSTVNTSSQTDPVLGLQPLPSITSPFF